jgi:hypothetical protein
MAGSRFTQAMGFVLAVLAACRGDRPIGRAADSTRAGRDSSAVLVIREAAVVAFWLRASDTLAAGEGADLLDDFRAYTQLIGPFLEDRGIPFFTTNAESLFVELTGGPRRVIILAGLDYPFGYVLLEPGYAESILTGVSTEEELLSEVDWYFGLDGEGDLPEGRGQLIVRRQAISCAAPPRPAAPASRETKASAGSRC